MIEALGECTVVFAGIGIITVGTIVVILLASAFVSIRDSIKLRIKKYRDRHKFEKPPTAKCYCIGCHLWYADDKERTMGCCGAWMDYHTSADEFCARGFPRSDDGYRDEEWRLEDRS